MSQRYYLAAILIAAAMCWARNAHADEIAQPVEAEQETLIPWDQLRGIRSAQTLREVADMLASSWNDTKRHAFIMAYVRQRQPLPGPPLLFYVHEWANEFCVLNDWPTPECLEVIQPRLYKAVINRT